MNVVNIAQPDVTLRLDLEGIIQEASVSHTLSDERLEAWVGRPWVETVADAAENKVRRMLEDARRRRVSAFRQVTQRFPSGREILIEYTTVRLGGRSGLIAVGKNLQAMAGLQSRFVAAQREMERDLWKLRDVETRYRLLFETSTDAVLVVRAASLDIVDANPAALAALDLTDEAAGRPLLPEVAPADRADFQAMLDAAREHGAAPRTLLHLGPRRRQWLVRASLMQADSGLSFLLQLTPADAVAPVARPSLDALIAALLDALTGEPGADAANPAHGEALDALLGDCTLDTLIEEVTSAYEQAYITRALRAVDGDRARAAELLGISARQLEAKFARFRSGRSARREAGQRG
jgi:transcriptional regulator PpsR